MLTAPDLDIRVHADRAGTLRGSLFDGDFLDALTRTSVARL